MQVQLYVLTVITDDAGDVITETRAPLPASFTQGSASSQVVSPPVATPSSQAPPPILQGFLEPGEYDEDDDEQENQNGFSFAPSPAVPAGAIPLFESDPEVLRTCGAENFKDSMRGQRQTVILDTVRPGGDPRQRRPVEAVSAPQTPLSRGKHAQPVRGRMSDLATDASPTNLMG